MSENSSQNRWIPFQCPACHGLFRLRKNQLGQNGRCPNCRAVLCASEASADSILKPENTPELSLDRISVAKTMTTQEAEDLERAMKNRKRRYALSAKTDGIDWEEQIESNEVKGGAWKVVVSLLMGAFALGVIGIYVLEQVTPTTGEDDASESDEKALVLLSDIVEASRNTGKDDEVDEASQAVDDYKKFDIPAVEAAVKSFLNAENVEEIKKTVRDVERVGPLLDLYYSKVDFETEGFESMNRSNVSYRGNLLTTTVQKADFLNSLVAVERVVSADGDSYKIDWESWVGYCDFTPEEMRTKNPTKPFTMRVLMEPANYYNYGFGDDKVWQALGLKLKSSDTFLGYVRKGSEIEKQLIKEFRDLRQGSQLSYVVKAAYLPNSRAKDQVEIVELVHPGWVSNKESFLNDE